MVQVVYCIDVTLTPSSLMLCAAQSQQDFREHWRNTAQYYFGSSGQQLQQPRRRVSITPSQTSRQRQAGSNATGSREPRPYYYRVQQQMQAGMANQLQRRLVNLFACLMYIVIQSHSKRPCEVVTVVNTGCNALLCVTTCA